MKTRTIKILIAPIKINASGSFVSEDGRFSRDVGSLAPANPV